MTSRFLQAVLRSFGDIGTPESDGELLRQFVAHRSEPAFAELVRRHGRLVWAVCRHLTRSEADADDAFQATFLVLLQNAAKVRDAGRLSAWLYGVAYKVCAKARQAAQRRTTREHSRAARNGNGWVVPDSAWDRALAAVHDEAAKLPDTLRVPFVLCCLEGKDVTAAAAQLGWKLGTFSGRLTRAKDAVLARLNARGLTLGAVASVGLAIPPAAAVAKTTAMAQSGFVIPLGIQQLTQGVIGMSMKSVKLLAATVTLMCGLGLGVGAGWLGTADAQAPPQNPGNRANPLAEVQRLQAELNQARQAVAQQQAQLEYDTILRQKAVEDLLAAAMQRPKDETYSAKTTKWEYDFVAVSDMGQAKFVEFLQDRENRGWEFNGQTTLRHDGKATGVWVFRRPARGAAARVQLIEGYRYPMQPKAPPAKQDSAKAIEAEIELLHAKLKELQAKSHQAQQAKSGRTVFAKDELPLEPGEFAEVLKKLAQKRFPGRTVTITSSATGITMEGDAQVRSWAAGVIYKLGEK